MTRGLLLLSGCLSVALNACSTSPVDEGDRSRADASTPASEAQWHSVFAELNSLVLAGWAASEDDAFFVGAEGQVLRYRDAHWYQFEMSTLATLWWVWGTSSSNVYVAGEEGTLLHFDGTSWSRVAAGLSLTQTIWGIWGANDGDIWVVGGNARSNGPGFVLRGNGRQFTAVDLGEEVPNLFKVWGANHDDVYLVGEHGLVIHVENDEATFQHLDPDEDGGRVEALFTVAGNAAGDVVTVGGVSAGMLFEKHGATWQSQPLHTLGLNGVAVAPSGEAYAVGLEGTIRHRVANQWLAEDHGQGRHYHSAILMGEVAFAVGGDLLSPQAERRGLIAASGNVASTEITWIPAGDVNLDAGRGADHGAAGTPSPGTDGAAPDGGHQAPQSPPGDSGLRDSGADEAGTSDPNASDGSIPRGGPSELCMAEELTCNPGLECWYVQGEEEERCVTPCTSPASCPAQYGPNPQCAPPGCQTLYTVCMPAGWRGCF